MGRKGPGDPVSVNVAQAGTHYGDVYFSAPAPSDDAFTAGYLRFMSRSLDGFEFFGVDPRGVSRKHHFEAGYVPLTLNRRDSGDDATVSVGARADQALGDCSRALIRGVAGSGKSTLLRWLGIHSREDSVPFLVELGRFPHGRPPALEDAVAPALRRGMPDGWVDRILAGDRGLLLLDGLDEVRPRERAYLEDWVDEYLNLYPSTRCFVSTRPSTVAEQWWIDRDFQRFNLLPMSRHSIGRYVVGWHDTARADRPDIREELDRAEQGLLTTLSNRPALRGMSANPLLCGLLCALHLERGEHLPENRKQVYDAAVDLLLRWRTMRHHRAPDDDTAIESPLSDEELLKLFQRLAFWLVTNRQLVLPADVAIRRVASYMNGLRHSDEDPERVVQYLAHNSGLLRELPDRSLAFMHRTFRDHLAAKEVVEEENLPLMLDNADKPHWHDVVVMAGAHARPGERTRILRELLERGREDTRHREALYLLAAAILEQAAVLPHQDIRDSVAEAMAELMPPRTSAAADQLAAAGAFVLDLMPGPKGLTKQEAALVVRAVARIAARWNPPGAIDKILQYAEQPTNEMLTQLLEAWGRHGDYEAYARDVLSELDFSRFNVDLQTGRRIDHVGHLKSITTLTLRNDVLSLRSLEGLPRLRRLVLRGNTMTSVDHLAGVPSLRVLVLDRCSSVAGTRRVDLSPLAAVAVRRIEISGLTTKVDLAGLDLHSLCVTTRIPGALPDSLWVRHLVLLTGKRVDFTGVRGVRSLVLDWSPDKADLAALPELRRLVLIGVDGPIVPGVSLSIL